MAENWYSAGMRVSVDRAGRMVIPKPFRTALGIGPETEVELVVDGGGLRIDPVRAALRPVEEEDGLPLLGFVPDMVVTEADVRRLRDEGQR